MSKKQIAQAQAQLTAAQTVATRGTAHDDFATMIAIEAAVAAAACADDGSVPVIDIGTVYTIACPLTR